MDLRRWFPILTVAAASLLVGATIAWVSPVGGISASGSRSTVTTSGSVAPEDLVPTQTVPAAGLKDLILPPTAPGFVEVPEGLADTGPLDAAKLSGFSTNPESTSTHLREDDFLTAFRRGWAVRGGGEVIVVTVLEFGTGKGAADWQRRRLLGARLQSATEFDTAGLTDAFGFRTDESSNGLTLHDRVIVLRRHNFFVEMLWGTRATDQPTDPVIAQARAQAAKLEST